LLDLLVLWLLGLLHQIDQLWLWLWLGLGRLVGDGLNSDCFSMHLRWRLFRRKVNNLGDRLQGLLLFGIALATERRLAAVLSLDRVFAVSQLVFAVIFINLKARELQLCPLVDLHKVLTIKLLNFFFDSEFLLKFNLVSELFFL
jgi:hypothetical protein